MAFGGGQRWGFSQTRCSREDSSEEGTGPQLMPCFFLPDLKTGDEGGEKQRARNQEEENNYFLCTCYVSGVSHLFLLITL